MIRTFCCAVAFFESKKIRMRKIVRMCAEMMLGLLLVSCGVSELGEYAKDKNGVWTAPSVGESSKPLSTTYVTAFDYPEGYDWRHNPEKGSVRCSLVVFADSKPILKIPVGDDYMVSDDPDMHRVLNGHLYTDFATDSETVLKKDGKPLFSFDGREFIVSMVEYEDSVYTLGHRRNGKGFVYRVNGRPVLERANGYTFGKLAVAEDVVCFAFAEPIGSSKDNKERYYCVRNGSVSQTALREDVKKVWDVCFHQGKVHCLASLTGVQEPVVISDSGLEALSMPYGTTIVSGQIFSMGNGLGAEMLLDSTSGFVSALWVQNRLLYKSESGMTLSSLWVGNDSIACVLNSGSISGGGCVFRMGECFDFPDGFSCLGAAPIDVADGILTVGLSSLIGEKPLLWKDGRMETLDVNGYICTITSVEGK